MQASENKVIRIFAISESIEGIRKTYVPIYKGLLTLSNRCFSSEYALMLTEMLLWSIRSTALFCFNPFPLLNQEQLTDGWMTRDFPSFLTVSKSYQNDG